MDRKSIRYRFEYPDHQNLSAGYGHGPPVYRRARLLWDLVVPEVDPLSPENVFVFTFGPLTGTILDANSGGFQGMQFKKTGQIVSVDGGLPEAFLRQMIRSVN